MFFFVCLNITIKYMFFFYFTTMISDKKLNEDKKSIYSIFILCLN